MINIEYLHDLDDTQVDTIETFIDASVSKLEDDLAEMRSHRDPFEYSTQAYQTESIILWLETVKQEMKQ